MHLATGLLSLLLVPLASASPFKSSVPIPETELEPRVSCAKALRIFAVSGRQDADPYGKIQFTVDLLRKTFPGSVATSVPYDKMNYDFNAAVASGASHLRSAIKSYVKSCPKSPIVLAGYSQGGVSIMSALCGKSLSDAPFPAHYNTHILLSIVYGEESFVSGQPYDRGTCTKGRGEFARDNSAHCKAFANNILSYCDGNDPLCCGGGGDTSAHNGYPGRYNRKVMPVVKAKYKKFKAASSKKSAEEADE